MAFIESTSLSWTPTSRTFSRNGGPIPLYPNVFESFKSDRENQAD
jgi:hypothetical protein